MKTLSKSENYIIQCKREDSGEWLGLAQYLRYADAIVHIKSLRNNEESQDMQYRMIKRTVLTELTED